MKVLVACEFSGIVREAFNTHNDIHAISCDLLPAEDGSDHHLQCDVRTILEDGWDLMIAHPPCTHLAVSGARWFDSKKELQEEALRFVLTLLNAPIPMIAIENPVSIISSRIRKPDQIIQPYQFGHAEVKTTCLWLKNLPPLVPTNVVLSGRNQSAWKEPPSEERWKNRSRTFIGIAKAMAEQWIPYAEEYLAGNVLGQMKLFES